MSIEATFVVGLLGLLTIICDKVTNIPSNITNLLSRRFRRAIAVFAVIGIIASIAAQSVQYVFASTSDKDKRRLERELARVLYLFAERNETLNARYLADKPYVAGYQAFRRGHFADARTRMELSISQGKFLPESHYIIGYMSLLEADGQPNPDFGAALENFRKAAAADPDYAAPYYARAIIEVRQGQVKDAMKHLRLAATLDGSVCVDLQEPQEIDRWWLKVWKVPAFADVQRDCRARWGLEAKAFPHLP